jgi:Effector Associated Constant Component 1
MESILKLNSEQLDDAGLHALALNLCQALNEAGANTDSGSISASMLSMNAGKGVRGDLVSAATILLTLIGSGGVVVTLIQVLKAYVERDRHLRINIKSKDGTSVEIDGSNLNGRQLNETTDMLIRILGE